jgi:Restriction endonuclease
MAQTARKVKTPAWKQFEEAVAQVYRELGAQDVSCDVNIAGHQVDVFARVPTPDGFFYRYAISCKDYASSTGIASVKEWHQVYSTLRAANKADIGVIVSASAFSREAKQLAEEVGLRLITFSELKWANTDLHPYPCSKERLTFQLSYAGSLQSAA